MLFFLKKWLWGKVRQMLWGKVRHCGERSNPGKTVPIYQIAGLVNEAFLSAVTPRNITSGFRSTGIFPYNRDIFPEEAFAPNEPPADEPPAADDPLADAGPSTARGPHGCACQLTQMCHVFPADLDMCLLVKSYHFPNVPPEHKPKESV